MKSFFTDNVNSLLGAISLHLLVVIIFLLFKLGENNAMQEEETLFEMELVAPEEKTLSAEMMSRQNAAEILEELDNQTLHNIASNVAGKLEPEISTSAYEQQVLQELGISSLESPGGQMEKTADVTDENAIEQKPSESKTERDLNVPNVIRKDNTTVSYFLEGRWHSYIYIPTYKCQGGGTVLMDIMINQTGNVVSAIIQENKSTQDLCLREEAYKSAVSARFNADLKASAKQLGTITYVFLAQ